MIVVSDTTPIISLLKINQLEILEKLFGNVQIPCAVYDELTSNSKFQEEVRKIQECTFIEIEYVEDSKSVNLLRRATGLDAGESEAIVLVDNQNADLLLMDEVKGRQVAKQMGIKVMGTIGLLLSAYEEKYLTKVEIENCITELNSSGRHISNKLFEQLLEKIEIIDRNTRM